MDDALVVSRRERVGDLNSEVQRAFDRHGTPPEDVREALALDVLHDDVRVGPDVEHVVDGGDVRVGESPGGAGFAVETPARIGEAEPGGGRLLERDLAAEPRVPREIHVSHAAGAEL